MALYADQIPRLSLAQLRAQYAPRRFKKLSAIELRVGDVATVLKLVTTKGDGCVRGERRWIECHTCRRHVNVVGYAPGFSWSCRRCLGWRARNRPVAPATEGDAVRALLGGGPEAE